MTSDLRLMLQTYCVLQKQLFCDCLGRDGGRRQQMYRADSGVSLEQEGRNGLQSLLMRMEVREPLETHQCVDGWQAWQR